MNKMTVIQLLNKIANGEEVPKEVEYNNSILHYDSQLNDYCCDYEDDEGELHGEYLFTSSFESIANNLNDTVEILEEEPKVQVELTEKEYLEYLDKINEYMESVRNYIPKPSFLKLEEEKKIPEKINISNFPRHNNSLKKTAIKVNEIIDYLKSKGE